MQLSIVIVSFRVKELLLQCLHSLFATAGKASMEVIVVDNNSADGTVEAVASMFPGVVLVANQVNAGFSAANNQGMALAKGDRIFLLNPDTEALPGAIRDLLAFADRQEGDFVIGPALLNTDKTLQVSAWKKPSVTAMLAEVFFLHRLLHVSEYPRGRFTSVFSPGMLSGAALLFPKDIYKKTGGLDPELFWMEDADFCRRSADAGAALFYFPGAAFVHHSGQSSKKNQRIAITNQLLSKLKYYRKHDHLPAFLAGVFFCFLQLLSRIMIFGICAPFSKAAAEKARAYVFATGRYFHYLFTGDKSVTW